MFLDYKHKDFISTWGGVDNDCIFTFGWTCPLRKGTITILIHIYCPRLAPHLVVKIHLQKSETCPLDHVKAQMVDADFYYQMYSHVSEVQKKSHVCTGKLHLFNCECEKISGINCRASEPCALCWPSSPPPFSSSSAEKIAEVKICLRL